MVSYRYKVGLAADIDCSVETGYTARGSEIDAGTPITGVIGSDGDYTLCVVGNDGMVEQSLFDATSYSWTKDLTVVSISSVTSSSADGAYKTGSDILISVTFNGSMTLTATPKLKLNTGVYAPYQSHNGTKITFKYTVGSGELINKLEVDGPDAIDLQGGTCKDANDKDVDLTLPTSGLSSLSGTKNIVIDGSAPDAPTNLNDGTTFNHLENSPTLTWNASTDLGSGVSHYQLAIGTSPGGTNTLNWTDVGNVTSYQRTSLSLTEGTTYYPSIRAVDLAGNTSSAATGDGWTTTNNPIDCSSESPFLGSKCTGGTLFAGVLTDADGTYGLIVTPAGCTDETNPTCSGSGEDLTKSWGVRNVTSPVKTYTYLTESSAPGASAKLAAQGSADAQAAKYCESMNYGGFSDWYLPNETELKYLTDSARASLLGLSGFYWSSNENSDGINAYRVGSGSSASIGKSNLNKVRCVRREALKLSAAPSSLYDLHVVLPGTTSEWETITISNPSLIKTKNLTTVISGANLEINSATNTCQNAPLAGGDSCVVQVRINSETSRLSYGSLSVSDGAGLSLTVPLSGYVAVDCQSGSPVTGDICKGGIPYSGPLDYGLGDIPTMATPGGCDSTSSPVCNNKTDYVIKAFSTGAFVNHATSDSDGEANTAYLDGGWSTTDAAKYCANMVFGGFDDWYLPAKEELNHLVLNKTAIGGFDTNKYYWSSSQINNTNSLAQYFWNASTSNYSKTSALNVRCMRKSENAHLNASPTQFHHLDYERPATFSEWRTATVTNSTNASTLPLSTSVSAAFLEIKTATDTCNGAVLAPGESCSLELRISTSTSGKYSGSVAVSDANGLSVKIGVSGLVAADCSAATAPSVGSYCRGGVKYGGVSTNHRIMVAPAGCSDSSECTDVIDTVKKKFNSSFDPADFINGTTEDNSILNAVRHATKAPTTQAHIFCANLVYAGYSDWMLPAKNDLTTLYNNRSSIGGFAAGNYWSSTEKKISGEINVRAAARSFTNGTETEDTIGTQNFVRCIRKFH